MKLRFAAVLLSATCLVTSAHADPGKWGAHIDMEGRWSKARTLGDGGLFAPLWQNQNTLVFTDIRGKFDSQEGREGNFGFGVRHMLANGWNLGMYGYYDVRRSPLGNTFNQLTFGAEALSADWDVRLNAYAPVGSASKVMGNLGGVPYAEIVGNMLQIVTPVSGQLIERAMAGVDGEFGWRAPVFDVDALTQVRLYGGGYYFRGDSITPDIAGPRGRIEFSVDDLFGFTNARLTLGGEFQHDNVRGSQAIATARLRIPLQAETKAPRLSAQERRMTERVVRDVDIVSGTGRRGGSGVETREHAVNSWNNLAVTRVQQVAATNASDLESVLDTDPTGSVIILNGALTNLTGSFTVNGGQTLIGGGTVLELVGGMTGVRVNFTAPGDAGSISGTDLSQPAHRGLVQLGTNAVLGGLNISVEGSAISSAAISAVGVSNVSIFNNVLNSTVQGNGIVAWQTTNATIAGNTLNSSIDGAYGIYGYQGSGTVIRDNQVTYHGFAASGVYVDGTSNSVITGNTVTRSTHLGNGIAVTNAVGGSILSNHVTTSAIASIGIWVSNGSGQVVDQNTVQGTAPAVTGIQLQDMAGHASVTNNSVTLNGEDLNGIILWGINVANGPTVSGNNFAVSGNNSIGISVRDAAGTITGNTISLASIGVQLQDNASALAGSTGNISTISSQSRCNSLVDAGWTASTVGFTDMVCYFNPAN